MNINPKREKLLKEIVARQEAQAKVTYALPPQGYETNPHIGSYGDMLRDATVSSCMDHVRTDILAQPWTLTAGTGPLAAQIAKEIEENLREIDVDIALENAIEALGRGFFPHEIVWDIYHDKAEKRRKFRLCGLSDINPEQIAFEVDDQMKITGIISRPIFKAEQTYSTNKIWLHQHRPSRRYPAGRSILEPAYRPWFAKDNLLKTWGLNLQRYGIPLIILKAPDSLGGVEYTNLLTSIYGLRLDGVAIIPDSVAYEIINPGAQQGLNFEIAISYHDAQIRQAIELAKEQPQMPGGGSTRVSGQGIQEIAKVTDNGLARWSAELCTSFTKQVIQPLVYANYGEDITNVPRFTLPSPINTAIAQDAQQAGGGGSTNAAAA